MIHPLTLFGDYKTRGKQGGPASAGLVPSYLATVLYPSFAPGGTKTMIHPAVFDIRGQGRDENHDTPTCF